MNSDSESLKAIKERLEETKADLTKEIDRELEAIELLIKGALKRERKENHNQAALPLEPEISLSYKIRREIDNYTGERIGTAAFRDRLLAKNIGTEKTKKDLRNLVYTIFKEYVKKGIFKPENLGTKEFPKIRYTRITDGKLAKN